MRNQEMTCKSFRPAPKLPQSMTPVMRLPGKCCFQFPSAASWRITTLRLMASPQGIGYCSGHATLFRDRLDWQSEWYWAGVSMASYGGSGRYAVAIAWTNFSACCTAQSASSFSIESFL